MHLCHRTASQLVAVSLLATIGSFAQAKTDWKTYPATLCKSSSSVTYNEYGAICSNLSQSSNISVYCPIVRDYGKSRFPIQVKHSGRTGNRDVALRCSVRSMRKSGTNAGGGIGMAFAYLRYIITASGRAHQGGSFIYEADTSFSTINNSLLPMDDYGPLVLACVLPRSETLGVKPCLTSYSVREWDGS